MQIVFIHFRHIFPCTSSELTFPVCGCTAILFSFFENIIILIFFISGQCFLEPFMIAGGMVKYHIQHQFDVTLLCLSGKLFKIFHRTVTGINVIVILHIITVIILGGHKKRSHPNIVHAQFFYII